MLDIKTRFKSLQRYALYFRLHRRLAEVEGFARAQAAEWGALALALARLGVDSTLSATAFGLPRSFKNPSDEWTLEDL